MNLPNFLLTENIGTQNIIDAIKKRHRLIITYDDEVHHKVGKRYIEPYVLGTTKAGNKALRAFQYNGDTWRGVPKWKLFRLDRIKSIKDANITFYDEPSKERWTKNLYNDEGDNSLIDIDYQVSFDNDNEDDLYSPSLYQNRNKTKRLQNSKPLKLSDLEKQNNDTTLDKIDNNSENKPQNTKPIDFNSQEFKDMLARNLERTNQERVKRGQKEYNFEPNTPQTDINDNPPKIEPENEPVSYYDSEEFKNMLARNLERTNQERTKRGQKEYNFEPNTPQTDINDNPSQTNNEPDNYYDSKEFKDMLARNLERTNQERVKRGQKEYNFEPNEDINNFEKTLKKNLAIDNK